MLFVGELVRHKRPELAIEAAAGAGRRDPGRRRGARARSACGRATAAGSSSWAGSGDAELAAEYAAAAALVVPNVEEFGIAASRRRPPDGRWSAVDAGGTRETVVPGRTGLLVPDGDRAALARALREDLTRFDPHDISAHAQQFSRDAFQIRLREVVETTWAQPEGARRPASHAARSIRRLASERPASP